jgi:hypothetical protein
MKVAFFALFLITLLATMVSGASIDGSVAEANGELTNNDVGVC